MEAETQSPHLNSILVDNILFFSAYQFVLMRLDHFMGARLHFRDQSGPRIRPSLIQCLSDCFSSSKNSLYDEDCFLKTSLLFYLVRDHYC